MEKIRKGYNKRTQGPEAFSKYIVLLFPLDREIYLTVPYHL